MRKAGAFFALLFAFGCAAASEAVYLPYLMSDRPDLRRIELRYRNNTKSAVCVSPDFWPNQAGKIHEATDILVLVVGNERFPVVDFNTGYCPQGCYERVAPGQEIFGFISYDDFQLPERLWTATKRLEFRPQGFACR